MTLYSIDFLVGLLNSGVILNSWNAVDISMHQTREYTVCWNFPFSSCLNI